MGRAPAPVARAPCPPGARVPGRPYRGVHAPAPLAEGVRAALAPTPSGAMLWWRARGAGSAACTLQAPLRSIPRCFTNLGLDRKSH